MRCRPAAAALIEKNRPIGLRIEKTAVVGLAPGPRPSVQKQDRNAFGITDLLYVELVSRADGKAAGGIGLDGWIEIFHGGRVDYVRFFLHR